MGQRWKTRVKDLKSQATSVVGPGLRFYFIRTFLNGVALTLSVIPLRLGPLFYDKTVKSVTCSEFITRDMRLVLLLFILRLCLDAKRLRLAVQKLGND